MQYKYGKECKFYINWCTVIVSIKFLFDFLDPDNLDSTLLKLCKLILPSVHFLGLHNSLILQTSLQRKNIHSNMLCYTQKWVIHWYFKFWVLLSRTCRQKLSVEWHWIKFFIQIFCISVSFISTADKFVANVRELDSHHRYINTEWIYKECKAWF